MTDLYPEFSQDVEDIAAQMRGTNEYEAVLNFRDADAGDPYADYLDEDEYERVEL